MSGAWQAKAPAGRRSVPRTHQVRDCCSCTSHLTSYHRCRFSRTGLANSCRKKALQEEGIARRRLR